MSAQFLYNNLVKFCCARLNKFKLCILKTLILKELNRYDLCITEFSQKPKTYQHHNDALSLFFLPYKLVI